MWKERQESEFPEDARLTIEAPKAVMKKIAETFGVSQQTVYNALTYDRLRGQSLKAKRIRKMALENGCREMVTVPKSRLLDCARHLLGAEGMR